MTRPDEATGAEVMNAAENRKTHGAKMQFLIRRNTHSSREQLIAHWFAHHMPRVIARNEASEAAGEAHFSRYLVTLFDAQTDERNVWDGVAQLWLDEPMARPAHASGTVPADSFHEKAEPYWPWATEEWVFVDGLLPVEPLTLDAPYPCSRSGFVKQTSLVAARQEVDIDAMFSHWLEVHAPNVVRCMEEVGGIRYMVSLSTDLAHAPYAGMAELYFPDELARQAFWDIIEPDGFQDYADPETTRRFVASTEFIGRER